MPTQECTKSVCHNRVHHLCQITCQTKHGFSEELLSCMSCHSQGQNFTQVLSGTLQPPRPPLLAPPLPPSPPLNLLEPTHPPPPPPPPPSHPPTQPHLPPSSSMRQTRSRTRSLNRDRNRSSGQTGSRISHRRTRSSGRNTDYIPTNLNTLGQHRYHFKISIQITSLCLIFIIFQYSPR